MIQKGATMAKKQKRLERLRQNPKNVTFEELRQVMEDYGFLLDRASGSHFNFRAEVSDQVWKITIPFKKPYVKEHYVKEVLKAVDEIRAAKTESEDSDE